MPAFRSRFGLVKVTAAGAGSNGIHWFPVAQILAAVTALSLPMGSVGGASRSSGGSQTVFVEPQAGAKPVLSLLAGARHSIRLEVYELTDADVLGALRAAKRRGVLVQVLLEQHPYGGSSYARRAYDNLRSAGIAVRWANEAAFTFTHEKAVDVDNTTAGIFTFNLSYSAFDSNREFGVISHSATDAKQVGAIFNADWNRTRATLTNHSLVVSPINARGALTRFIDSTRTSLDLYEEEMLDRSIENHLASAVRRKVSVRLITSRGSSGVAWLRRHGVKIVLMESPFVHAKAMVADGRRLFIGSENMSSTSLDRNRELGILIDQSSLASQVGTTFQADWQANGGGGGGPSHGKLPLSVSARPNPVKRYQLLTISARTSASASCTITVTYPDGYVSRARALQGAKLAGASGRVFWSWHVDSTVTGAAHASVACRLGDKAGQRTIAFGIAK